MADGANCVPVSPLKPSLQLLTAWDLRLASEEFVGRFERVSCSLWTDSGPDRTGSRRQSVEIIDGTQTLLPTSASIYSIYSPRVCARHADAVTLVGQMRPGA